MNESHAPADLRLRPILWVAASLVAVVMTMVMVLYWLYPHVTPSFEPASRAWMQTVAKAPQLQIHPQADWQQLHRQQEAQLHSYGWTDRSAGIVHLPIEAAMRLLPERRPEVVIEPAEGTP